MLSHRPDHKRHRPRQRDNIQQAPWIPNGIIRDESHGAKEDTGQEGPDLCDIQQRFEQFDVHLLRKWDVTCLGVLVIAVGEPNELFLIDEDMLVLQPTDEVQPTEADLEDR